MKINYGILGLVIISIALMALWHVASPPQTVVENIEHSGAAFLPKEIQRPPLRQSAVSTPALPTPDEPAIALGLAQLPMLSDTPEIRYDTGPFVDADPNKPIVQSLDLDSPIQNAGEFVDADGLPANNPRTSGTVQSQK